MSTLSDEELLAEMRAALDFRARRWTSVAVSGRTEGTGTRAGSRHERRCAGLIRGDEWPRAGVVVWAAG
ncbi:hypothetical protein GA0074694_5007 [Micromonospora inyonensis]|uniref:Uncharacterized protein n=1 Tax=Micromonospora inyonensis TaxID=47866 RepID=A0A1C6SFG5_9ACTN|nr:hypothetical protein GA0074694_5007 [Micromonospora inyonensis]